ncbi:MAG: type IV pilus assembly protein PilM [candidate division Zixibacteria bacterium]|nr:type IV pilus assembly protein PilM [candidate division Zixibacteria bacterium]
MKIPGKSKNAIGLDIGSNSIKLAKLGQKGDTFELRSIGYREISPEAMVASEIKDREAIIFDLQNLIDQYEPKAKDVVVSIEGHGIITDKINIDKKSGAEAEQAILFEAEQRSPFDVEDVTMDFHIINVNEETNKMDVLLVAARNEYLRSYLSIITDAGLNPVIVDADSLAILNAFEINYEVDPHRVTALVNVGFDITNVTFINNGLYHSTRDVTGGARMIYESVQREFRLNQDLAMKVLKGEMASSIDQDLLKATLVTSTDELLSGLEIAFSYFKSSAKVSDIDWVLLSGGGSLIPHFPELLQSRLGTSVEIANPLRNIEYDPTLFTGMQIERTAPIFMVAIGLAARRIK